MAPLRWLTARPARWYLRLGLRLAGAGLLAATLKTAITCSRNSQPIVGIDW